MKLPINYDYADWRRRKAARLQYVKDQDGDCWWCKQPLSGLPSEEVTCKDIDLGLFPPNFLEHPIHLQHDHSTGMTEGAVHARCNAVMWQHHGR